MKLRYLLTLNHAATTSIWCNMHAPEPRRYSVGGVGNYNGTVINERAIEWLLMEGYLSEPVGKLDLFAYQVTPKGIRVLQENQRVVEGIEQHD